MGGGFKLFIVFWKRIYSYQPDVNIHWDHLDSQGKWKVQGVPQSQVAVNTLHQEVEEKDRNQDAQNKQTHENLID